MRHISMLFACFESKKMNKRITLIYGLISGLLIVSSWFITLGTGEDADFSMSEIAGYAIMIAALTAIFLGVKKIRAEKRSFSFKEGFMNGLGITLVASIIYVIGWFIYMPNFAPDFTDKYAAAQIALIENSEASEQEKQQQIEDTNRWIELYKQPHLMAVMTFIEIFPIGVILSMISALILKRKA